MPQTIWKLYIKRKLLPVLRNHSNASIVPPNAFLTNFTYKNKCFLTSSWISSWTSSWTSPGPFPGVLQTLSHTLSQTLSQTLSRPSPRLSPRPSPRPSLASPVSGGTLGRREWPCRFCNKNKWLFNWNPPDVTIVSGNLRPAYFCYTNTCFVCLTCNTNSKHKLKSCPGQFGSYVVIANCSPFYEIIETRT